MGLLMFNYIAIRKIICLEFPMLEVKQMYVKYPYSIFGIANKMYIQRKYDYYQYQHNRQKYGQYNFKLL